MQTIQTLFVCSEWIHCQNVGTKNMSNMLIYVIFLFFFLENDSFYFAYIKLSQSIIMSKTLLWILRTKTIKICIKYKLICHLFIFNVKQIYEILLK